MNDIPDIMKDINLEEKEEPDSCKGIFFRAAVSLYSQDDKVEQRIKLRLLKRRSCPGCQQCGWMLDDIREFAAGGNLDLSKIKHGKIYSPTATNVSVDWETGVTDDWDIEFFEVQEKEN